MKAFVFFVSIAIAFVNAKIEWPFKCVKTQWPPTCLKLSDFSLGTPEQQISEVYILTGNIVYCLGLWVPDLNEWSHGFNSTESSTFENNGQHYNSISGRDNFSIRSSPNDTHLAEKRMFNLVNDVGYCGNSEFSYLYILHATERDNNTFFDSIFKTEKEPIAVFVYDKFYSGKESDFYFNGTMILGERPNYCEDWSFVDEAASTDVNYPQWNFNLSRVSIEKFAASQPGPAKFAIDSQDFKLSYDVYNQAVEILGVDENNLMDCEINTEIVFKIGDVELIAGPDAYMDKDYPVNGMCSFKVDKAKKDDVEFVFPSIMLRNKCLMYNYKTFQIGFADKIQ